MEKAVAGRTTITIAYVTSTPLRVYFADTNLFAARHRLSTITKSDQIIVLHDGKIVERGTHDELLLLGGRYSTMWEKQSTIEKEKVEEAEGEEGPVV